MKNCGKCRIRKSISNFNRRKASKDGLQFICKTCCKKDRDSRDSYYIRYKSQNRYEYGKRGWALKTLADYRVSDKKKGHNLCNISAEEFLKLIELLCEYCGDLEDKKGFDRLDNSKGHTKCNVVTCCRLCNTARMASFTYGEMKLLGKTIAKIRQRRKK